MMCIHKNIFLEIGGFDDTPRFQDQYFMNKMLFSGYKVKMDSIPLYKMYEHDNNRITNTSVEQSIRALNILKKYKFNHQERFNQEQWKQIEYNYLRQKAGILFVSNNYMSRIKAFILYIQLFIKKPSVYAIRMMFRTLIIVKCRG